MTYSAESLRSSIKNHSHYGPCLNGILMEVDIVIFAVKVMN